MVVTKRDLELLKQQKETDKFEPYHELPRGEVQEVNGSIEGDLSYLVWIRQLETNGGIVQMFNPGHTLEAGMTVFYAPDPRKPAPWTIMGFDQSTYLGDAATLLTLANTGLVNHALNHELRPGLPGNDPLNIYSHALVDFACRPTSPVSMRVNIYSGWYPGDSTYQFFRGPVASKDFTSDVPGSSGQALIEAITIDNTGTFQYYTGTAYTNGDPVPSSAWPSVPIDELLITAIRLVNGMSSIQNENFDQEMRPVFGPGGFAGARKITELWESDFGAVAAEANAGGDVVFNNNIYMASGKFATGDAYGFIVENTSGATASPGDVGYLDDSSEYKTTTTAQLEAPWCVVLIGGANGADIYVTERGRVTVAYTGSAPADGDFLVTSTTAGSAQAQTVMRPEIFARCLGAGSGGTVSALLLCQRKEIPLDPSTNIFAVAGGSDSDFVAVVAAAGVSGDKVYHDPPSSGAVDAITPISSADLAKLVLHNTTQAEEAFIIATGTDGTDDFIQVSDSNDISGWVTSDNLEVRSQTNTSTLGAGTYWFDLEITSSEIPALATQIQLGITKAVDTGSTERTYGIHPYETNNNAKRKTSISITTTNNVSPGFTLNQGLIQRRFVAAWNASGSGTFYFTLRGRGITVAAP